jgi:predicted cobalt transporter CbtA
MWSQRLACVLGLWLMAAPSLLGLPKPDADVMHILGPLAAATGFIASTEVTRGVRWLNVPIGLAVIVAPMLLGYPMPAVALIGISGLALVALAFMGGRTTTSFGGGWRSLFS